MAGASQACDMSGRVSAAIGDHQERIRMQVVLQELELLGDAGLAVVVAAQGVSEDGNSEAVAGGRGKASGIGAEPS